MGSDARTGVADRRDRAQAIADQVVNQITARKLFACGARDVFSCCPTCLGHLRKLIIEVINGPTSAGAEGAPATAGDRHSAADGRTDHDAGHAGR